MCEPDEASIVFSYIEDNVWASWPGASKSVKLGRYEEVTYMMRDFLAQCELGERLVSRRSSYD